LGDGKDNHPLEDHILVIPKGNFFKQVEEDDPREPANPHLPGKMAVKWK